MSKRSKIKFIIAAILIGGIAYCAVAGTQAIAEPQKVEAASFDHSGCQYPDRTTNPADGCDNSDPCDPAQTKGGSGDCTDKGQCAGYPNGVCESCTEGQCTGKDATPPDPNRPYYDQYGNKYDYMGNLIEAAPTEAAPAPARSCSSK